MTHEVTRRTALRSLGVGVGTIAIPGGVTTAASGPETLFSHDPSIGELPENIAIDKRGTNYVSFPPRGEIREITPDGEKSLFAELGEETFPNDILLDGDSLLVTDTIGGAVLRVREGERLRMGSRPAPGG